MMNMLFFKKNLSLKLMLSCLVILLFLLVQGCLESENKLTVKKDGSGQLEVMYILGEEIQEHGQAQKSKDSPITKPISDGMIATEENLREQFQGEGISIEQSVFEKKEGKLHVFYTVTFDSLKNLLNTKAFQKGEVSFYRDKNNNLSFHLETASIRQDLEQKKMQGPCYNQEKMQPEIVKAICEGKGLLFLDTLPAGPKKTKSKGYVYDPAGKPDPFKPFILDLKRRKEEADKTLQPLQRYQLSQLKLVAIIWNIENPRALFEDSAGKGYIISKGALIGNNQGKVEDILKDEVVVVEKTADIFGATKTRAIRIRLHTGEEERKGK